MSGLPEVIAMNGLIHIVPIVVCSHLKMPSVMAHQTMHGDRDIATTARNREFGSQPTDGGGAGGAKVADYPLDRLGLVGAQRRRCPVSQERRPGGRLLELTYPGNS